MTVSIMMSRHEPARPAAGLIPTGWRFWRRPSLGRRSGTGVRHTARYEGVLGTTLELQLLINTREAGQAAEAAVLAEIDRLESIFSAYKPDSELCRWQQSHGEPIAVSPELAAVLRTAEHWRQRTDGAFHPAVEALTRLWQQSAKTGMPPDANALGQIVTEMSKPLWDVDGIQGTARRRTRLPVTLNAIAKGHIIDAACRTAMCLPGVESTLVNIGGDIRHAGGRPILAAITDPFAPQDNAPPLAAIRLGDQGLATSEGYHRGFRIGERWFSHLLDPRTGSPVDAVVNASVFAESAEQADVLATAFSVMSPDESLRLADDLHDVAVMLVTHTRQVHTNALWRRHAL